MQNDDDDALAAFERLYAAHGARLKSVACNLLGNVADAEDAVQEAFLKAHRAWGGFKGESAPFTWLYRILVNSCMDTGRRRKRRREEPEPEGPADTRPAPVVDHPLRLALETALRQLSPRLRAVFLLAEAEGFTHREIAEILDIAEGTSKHDLFQAKRELRLLLAGPRPIPAPGEVRA
ncbi:MAG TPA: RNA polymerase sigma factor [Vicinamibacteria bacterium]|nr:RNA polymerase sigma factor [Vicinamibacteria bacterium]